MHKHLIVIVGPTAIGKTSLSIALAQKYNTEILSADSRQFYKEMHIGTAKPSKDEMNGIKHHFIDSLSIKDEYTVGKFEIDFIQKCKNLFKNHDILIAVGGSGLFIKAICEGLDNVPSVSLEIRDKLMRRLEDEGIEVLQNELKLVDPKYYDMTDIENPHRIIRALEVYQGTGEPISSFQRGNVKKRPFNIIKIGLEVERNELYNRINQRVDIMVNNGLLEEVKSLFKFKDLPSLQTVGYQEFWPYFSNNISIEEAVELVKRNTRRFAKRQLTWFRKDQEIKWFQAGDNNNITSYLDQKILI